MLKLIQTARNCKTQECQKVPKSTTTYIIEKCQNVLKGETTISSTCHIFGGSPVTSADFTTTRDITRLQYIKDPPPHNLTYYCIQTKVQSLLALDKLFEPSQSFSLHVLLWPVLRVISCFRQSLGKVPHVNLFHLEDVIKGLLICL